MIKHIDYQEASNYTKNREIFDISYFYKEKINDDLKVLLNLYLGAN